MILTLQKIPADQCLYKLYSKVQAMPEPDPGFLLYKAKFQADKAAASALSGLIAGLLHKNRMPFDLIVPVPPGKADRPMQPVTEIVRELSERLAVPASFCLSKKTGCRLRRDVESDHEWEKLQDGSFTLSDSTDISGRNILLVDDVIGSGITVRKCAELLIKNGAASVEAVCVIDKRAAD
ncbi:MAG: phosphoribosyltransferase family protein [Candidatus Wallbacteria bacterium]|nr:phosphoribosyltransferase family protein [Candidatus Wallbacteria bacterium]